MTSAPTEILTVGHSNHEEQDFLVLLRGAGARMVLDVRRHPSSRRLPHFERSALAASLKEAGIGYEWMGESLGGRRSPAPDSPNGALEEEQLRGYADHMAGPAFAQGLAELERAAGEARTAIMCAEGDWRHCHRRLLADALVARGRRVVHLLGDGRLEEHEPSGSAVLRDGRLTYPAAQTSFEL